MVVVHILQVIGDTQPLSQHERAIAIWSGAGYPVEVVHRALDPALKF
jgi:hypothetical protein